MSTLLFATTNKLLAQFLLDKLPIFVSEIELGSIGWFSGIDIAFGSGWSIGEANQ